MPKKNWTAPLEQLLVTWAEKASGYAWLHQKSAIAYKKRNLCLSIPASVFGYVAGITVLLSNDVFNDCTNTINGPIIRGLIGITAITAGILSNFQEMFTFKEESEKHRIATLRFLSFFREISCELSLDPKYRSAPMDYITLKRFEFDKILEQSPDIPEGIIFEFNKKFKNLSIHKPDPVIGLQTIIPFGEELNQPSRRFISVRDKIILLKYFRDWRCKIALSKIKNHKSRDVLIEVANSRSSDMDTSLIEIDKTVELTERDRCHLMLHGILSEQKRFVQNQNIKIKRSPVCDESESDDSEPLSENLKE
jgi:hypothetical protein